MQDIDTLELLDILYQRFDSFQVLWTIYTTVAFGIIAALISFPKHLNSKLTRIILIVGFLAFAKANLGALVEVQVDRLYLVNELKGMYNCDNYPYKGLSTRGRSKTVFQDNSDNYKNGIEALICDKEINSLGPIITFHYFQDILIILLIWILPKSLVRLQLFKSISNLTIKIRGSNLPNPVISWDQGSRIWILEEDVHVGIQIKDQSDLYQLQIPDKFTFDLATIPRFLWGLIAPFELSIIAPLVHDFIYVKKGKLYINDENKITSDKTDTTIYISRLETDRIFLDHMKQEGVGKIKRYLCYYGVRWFGGMFWKEKNV